ncbi:MAG: MFS transporter [Bacteroidota bacterium]|nr:MFS transporter [Bacteroidota bacterium]
MSELVYSLERSRRAYRIAVGCLFFLQGLCFASWASRIPSIQQSLQLSDAVLGLVLFALPVGSMLSLPFTGWLVTRFGSKRVAANALLLYSMLLIALGWAHSSIILILFLVLFGMAGNTANIAINTQAVGVEAKYGRSIMASFHGLWSMAGFTAAGIGTFMMGKEIIPLQHFMMITGLILAGVAASFNFLLEDERRQITENRFFVKPDKSLLILGILAFCCMICEGAMFDWSGIYFQKVVRVSENWIGAGYTAFMCTMATGRFVADYVAGKIGIKKTIQLSGLLIATGLGIAVVLPFLYAAIIGFLLVGFGVSSVVPLVYSEAGKSGKQSPGMALTAVSSIGFLGFLVGPPVIGVISGIAGLRISFVLIAVIGLAVALMASGLKNKS